VFAGDENDVTLRIPAPEGTREVNGGTLEGGVVTVGGALFPGDQNRIVTAYIVRYDAAADEYGVRVTAPLPTDRIELRVPQGYVHEVEPLEEAAREDDLEMPQGETPEADDVTLEVVSLTGPVDPGRG